ncbi:MAG: hypothetical protein ACPGVD_04800 [Flavobacteriales bacterium]
MEKSRNNYLSRKEMTSTKQYEGNTLNREDSSAQFAKYFAMALTVLGFISIVILSLTGSSVYKEKIILSSIIITYLLLIKFLSKKNIKRINK